VDLMFNQLSRQTQVRMEWLGLVIAYPALACNSTHK